MFKRNNYLALGAAVFVAVVLLSLPTSATSRLKLAFGSLFLPLFGLATATQQLPTDLAGSVLPRRELLRQIDNLRRENQQLKIQQSQSIAIARENDYLRSHFGWPQQTAWQRERLIEHKHYIDQHGQDMPQILAWKWGSPA